MSAMPPASCLMSKRAGPTAPARGASAAHLQHVLAQAVAAHRLAQHRRAHLLEAPAQGRVSADGPGPQQRLMLPGPGLLELILLEGIDAGHEKSALAVRPQAHVHLVQPAAAECMVSRCTMRCPRRKKNTALSIGRAPSVC